MPAPVIKCRRRFIQSPVRRRRFPYAVCNPSHSDCLLLWLREQFARAIATRQTRCGTGKALHGRRNPKAAIAGVQRASFGLHGKEPRSFESAVQRIAGALQVSFGEVQSRSVQHRKVIEQAEAQEQTPAGEQATPGSQQAPVKHTPKAKATRKARQVIFVEETSQQIVYGFSNLTPSQAGPQAIATFLRKHWAIENRLRLSARCHLA